ncbi:hypothetical protein NDU88_006013 [Pleurodeles waltl]|uniref:Uncharacterized protein n=1 Tax=Pleurodeles waltl TaxID=8319 RepID=A0AAV7TDL2_PLEWA|nr:hypothetical protein NDU88_006013 [Pleurodeles waltl]
MAAVGFLLPFCTKVLLYFLFQYGRSLLSTCFRNQASTVAARLDRTVWVSGSQNDGSLIARRELEVCFLPLVTVTTATPRHGATVNLLHQEWEVHEPHRPSSKGGEEAGVKEEQKATHDGAGGRAQDEGP